MADRHAAAQKAAATRKARGIKTSFKLSSAQRSANAHKAAATRKARGQKIGFGKLSAAQRSANAHKAAQTRKAHGQKPFATMTAEERSARAKKAYATRLARGEKLHRHSTSSAHDHLKAERRSNAGRSFSTRRHITAKRGRMHALRPTTTRRPRPVL
jgi:hypothetical protein